jgi:hypothetical protein
MMELPMSKLVTFRHLEVMVIVAVALGLTQITKSAALIFLSVYVIAWTIRRLKERGG